MGNAISTFNDESSTEHDIHHRLAHQNADGNDRRFNGFIFVYLYVTGTPSVAQIDRVDHLKQGIGTRDCSVDADSPSTWTRLTAAADLRSYTPLSCFYLVSNVSTSPAARRAHRILVVLPARDDGH